jgi:hypothetical protein
MLKIVSSDIAKRNRYLIQSALIGVFIYTFTQGVVNQNLFLTVIVAVVLVVSGVLISHYPGVTKENFFFSTIMPFSVISGALLSLSFYPNLGFIFKMFVIFFFSGLYYLISLADNIFLVVHDREEIIPLFRVAVTWSQILQIIVAIPLLAGMFKLNVGVFTQSALASVVSILFTYYQLKIHEYEPDAKKTSIGERLYLCASSFFITYISSFAVSFFPSEDFLRALFVSSVMLFVLNYISLHLKNDLSRSVIMKYLLIILVFFILLLFFRL